MFKFRKKSFELGFDEVVSDDSNHDNFDYLEIPTSRRTFVLVAVFGLALVIIVTVRLGVLNIINSIFYQARASANISREINLPVYRAVITDRFGEPLAENTNSFSVFINIFQLAKSREALNSAVTGLSEILNIQPEEIHGAVSGANLVQDNWVAIARNITANEAIAVKSMNNDAVEVFEDYQRQYVNGQIFAHVIGYTGIGAANAVIGKDGVEFQYDQEIRGQEGKYVFYQDAKGKILNQKIISNPNPSTPLALTLDAGLQRFFYESLRTNLQRLGRESGIGIALNPQNGEILALVNFPSFDNNSFVNRQLTEERGGILNNRSQPLFNRAISGLYSPGSTIKPLVALGALREGVVDTQSRVFSSGSLKIPNPYYPDAPSIFLDWRAHGWVNLASALAQSSNVYFYLSGGGLPNNVPINGLIDGSFDIGGLGINRLNNYWEKFKFGVKTGVDLPGEASGFLPDPADKEARTGDNWRIGDTYNVSIGQGDFLVTPLQLINFISSIGNGGKIYQPFIKKDSAPKILEDYSDWQEELTAVQGGLRDAVAQPYGSSHILADLPMKVAGKTGTPQTRNNLRLNAFFAGYGPTDDPSGPKIAILVFVENAREGSLNALPIAKDVFRWYYENRIKNPE